MPDPTCCRTDFDNQKRTNNSLLPELGCKAANYLPHLAVKADMCPSSSAHT
jgi:hypothetical protein